MSKWTREQDEILRECGYMGVEGVRIEILERTGTWRSVAATQRRASRIGAPLVRYEFCPMCGKVVRTLKPSGLCPTCDCIERAREAREFADHILKPLGASDTGIPEDVRREAVAARQCKSRAIRKARQSGYVDSVNLSGTLSSSRSGGTNAQKKLF